MPNLLDSFFFIRWCTFYYIRQKGICCIFLEIPTRGRCREIPLKVRNNLYLIMQLDYLASFLVTKNRLTISIRVGA